MIAFGFNAITAISNKVEGYNSLTRINNHGLQIVSLFGFKRAKLLQKTCDHYETARDAASLFKDLTYFSEGKIRDDWNNQNYLEITSNLLSITANSISWIDHLDNHGIHIIGKKSLIGNVRVFGCRISDLRTTIRLLGKASMLVSTGLKAYIGRFPEGNEDDNTKNIRLANRDADASSTLFYFAEFAQECLTSAFLHQHKGKRTSLIKGIRALGKLSVSSLAIISGVFGARRTWIEHQCEVPETVVEAVPLSAPPLDPKDPKPKMTPLASLNHYLFHPVLKAFSILHSGNTDSYDKHFKFSGSVFKLFGHLHYGMNFPKWLNTAVKTSGRLSLYNNVPGFFENANAFNPHPGNPKYLFRDPSQFWSLNWILRILKFGGYTINKFCETGVLLERTKIIPRDLTQITGRIGNTKWGREINGPGFFQYFKDIFVIIPSIADSTLKQRERKGWTLDLLLTHLGNAEKVFLCNWFRKWIPLFGKTPIQFNWWLSADRQLDPTYATTNNRFHILFHTIALITSPTLSAKIVLANWRKG